MLNKDGVFGCDVDADVQCCTKPYSCIVSTLNTKLCIFAILSINIFRHFGFKNPSPAKEKYEVTKPPVQSLLLLQSLVKMKFTWGNCLFQLDHLISIYIYDHLISIIYISPDHLILQDSFSNPFDLRGIKTMSCTLTTS